MTPEIESYLDQLLSIRQDVPGLTNQLTPAQFNWRPQPQRWSIAQCLDHLNRTTAKFIPAMETAIATARQNGWLSPGPFSYPLLERWFVRSQEPPPGMRMKAFKAFLPGPDLPLEDVVQRFLGWQDQLEATLRQADGIDLRRAKHKSPILPILTWRLGTMFAITLAHERRHLWQARQVRNDREFPA